MKQFITNSKRKIAMLAMVAIAVMAMGIGFDQTREIAKSDNCAGAAPSTPTFNPWPLNYTGAECTDLPLIDARNLTTNDERSSRYANSASEHQAGINAAVGEQVRVSIYFHNGASDQIDRAQTTARNVRISSNFDTEASTTHTASASLSADNAATISSSNPRYGGNITINTATPTKLEFVPGSAFLCVRYAHAVERGADLSLTCGFNTEDNRPQIMIPISDSIANGTASIGDLKSCFPYAGFLYYSVKVMPAAGTPPPVPPTTICVVDYFTVNPTSVAPGGTVTLSWSVRNATSVTIDGASYPATGSVQSSPIFSARTFNLVGVGTGGNCSASATVAVASVPPPTAPCIVDYFTVSPSTVTSGQTATLSWSVRNATSVQINGVSQPATGTVQTQPLTASQTYTLTGVGPGGNCSAQANVVVTNVPPPPNPPCVVDYFTVSPSTVTSGQTATLSWSVRNATSVQINGVSQPATGTVQTQPLFANQTYTLTGVGTGGNCTASVNVTVTNVPPPPTSPSVSITKEVRDITQATGFATNLNVANGDTVEYRITVRNTGNVTLTNVVVTDALPSGLNYFPSSFGITVPGNTSTLSNIRVNSLAVGDFFVITFRAQVNQPSGSITNSASVTSDQANAGPAIAVINISGARPCVLTTTKLAKNLSNNSGTPFSSFVTANPGDRIAFQIQYFANAGAVTNITLRDILPSNFNYASGSARLNSATFADTFTSSNVNVGSLSSGQFGTLYYEGNVASNLPSGTTSMTNTVNISGDNMGTCSASATVNATIAPPQTNPAISIVKLVRNVTQQGSLQKSVNALTNDRVGFQITVSNVGSAVLNNAYVTDILPSGLSFVSGSVRLDGNSASDILVGNRLSLGNLGVNQTRTIALEATVNAAGPVTLVNTAQAGSDNVNQVQDTATVFVSQVLGSNVNLVLSKRAFNDTKNIDATLVPANRENFITYTLTVMNTGNAPANNFVISDDLSNVLSYASMVETNGGTLNGNVLTYPAVTVPAGGTITKTFKVRVNYNLPARSNLSLINTYGNTVTVKLQQALVLGEVFVAPKTGADSMTYGLGFAALMTLGFALLKKRGIFASIPNIRIN